MNPNERHKHAMAEFRHSHEFGGQNREGERRTAWVTWLTLVTMAVEIAAGWMTGSMALLADGWHMGTHATALGIAWAAYAHVLADALTSVLAIAALLAARQWGWMCADPLMGIVGGAIILRWAWTLVRETGHVLIDGDVDPAERDAIRKVVESDGETRVADLHIWRVGAREKAAILSLVTGCPQPPAHYRELLRPFEDLKHISIEVNVCAGKAPDTCR